MDWKRIKAEYIAGAKSLRELAEKYGVSPSTLRKVAAKEQWSELRNKTRTKMDEKISDSISEKEAEKTVNINNVADKLLDKIAELMDAIPLSTRSMKELTSALKDLKDIKGYKSDADMREQEARIAKLQKEAQEEDNSTTEIKVTFGSNDSEDGEVWAE